jgi:hypothetical protein
MRVPAVVFFDGFGVHVERQEHCGRTKQGHDVLSSLSEGSFEHSGGTTSKFHPKDFCDPRKLRANRLNAADGSPRNGFGLDELLGCVRQLATVNRVPA